jgi:aspartate ammonia-lyase
VVIRLGDEFGAYARTLQKNKKYLQEAKKILHELNFGGTATGSLQNITPAMRKELIRAFGVYYKTTFKQA